MKVKIKNDEIRQYLGIEEDKFKTYVSPLINLANTYAHGTRPDIVGQMSELIQEFKGKNFTEWAKWYLEKKPFAISNATRKIMQKLKELIIIMEMIDERTVERWVRDLVIVKTYTGLRFQEAILKKIAEKRRTKWRLATPEEESKGIDGFIGDIPVSIKPETYKLKPGLPEAISIKIIFYEKLKDGIEIDLSQVMKL